MSGRKHKKKDQIAILDMPPGPDSGADVRLTSANRTLTPGREKVSRETERTGDVGVDVDARMRTSDWPTLTSNFAPAPDDRDRELNRELESDVDDSQSPAGRDDAAMQLMDQKIGRRLLLLNALRDAGLTEVAKIDLPRIVAVGGQSAGKSSVLESIVGLDIFPRNKDVCTRRPIELRLVHSRGTEGVLARFDSKDGSAKELTSVAEIRREIAKLNADVKGQIVRSDPIVLSIKSAACPDLTVIDLPGIARNAASAWDRDRQQDLEKATKELTRKYISQDRTIILAVSAANSDLAVSDAIQIPREVDKEGLRTIGILTKVDIMDEGTDASEILRGEKFPLKKGYFALKNRSQKDIDAKKGVQEALESEQKFFESHPTYGKFQRRCGTRSLVTVLQKEIVELYDRHIPKIRDEISEMIKREEHELKKLGAGVPDDKRAQMKLAIQLSHDFLKKLKGFIKGACVDRKDVLYGGAQIRKELFDKYGPLIRAVPLIIASDDDLYKQIMNMQGDRPDSFVPFEALEALCAEAMARFEQPSLALVQRTGDAVRGLVKAAAEEAFGSYSVFKEKIVDAICATFEFGEDDEGGLAPTPLQAAVRRAEEHVRRLVECEKYIYVAPDASSVCAQPQAGMHFGFCDPTSYMKLSTSNPNSDTLIMSSEGLRPTMTVVAHPAAAAGGRSLPLDPQSACVEPWPLGCGSHIFDFVVTSNSEDEVHVDFSFRCLSQDAYDAYDEEPIVIFSSTSSGISVGRKVPAPARVNVASIATRAASKAIRSGDRVQMRVDVHTRHTTFQLFVNGKEVLREPCIAEESYGDELYIKVTLFNTGDKVTLMSYYSDRYAINLTKKLLGLCFEQAVASLASAVPKAVGTSLLKEFPEELEDWLQADFIEGARGAEGGLRALLAEPRDVEERRQSLTERLKVLRKSQNSLNLLG